MIKRWTTTFRMAFALAMMSSAILLALGLFGLYGNEQEQRLLARARLCESLAVACSHSVSMEDENGVEFLLNSLVRRNPDVLSAAIRMTDGNIRYRTSGHSRLWQLASDNGATSNCIYVPVMKGSEKWGRVEVCYERLVSAGVLGFLHLPTVRIPFVATLLNLLVFAYTLRRCFGNMDASKIVPGRVRSALDSLAEGLLLLDQDQRIVHANKALCETIGQQLDEFRGQTVACLPWSETMEPPVFHWDESNADRQTTYPVMKMGTWDGHIKSFNVNASPITDDDGICRGTLVSLDDITEIDKKNVELNNTLAILEESRNEISEQNAKLQLLATQDPLTGCLNRRAFFSHFDDAWKQFKRYQIPLACVMVDIDFFKQINDTFGHSVGDEVLSRVGSTLIDLVRDTDFVCRYGGEEFCILLPHIDLEGGYLAGERYRKALASLKFSELSITASIGVSDTSQKAASAQDLIDQADKCLYAAKRRGRNQVIRFDQLKAMESSEAKSAKAKSHGLDAKLTTAERTLLPVIQSLKATNAQIDKSRQLSKLCAKLIALSRSEEDCSSELLDEVQTALTQYNDTGNSVEKHLTSSRVR